MVDWFDELELSASAHPVSMATHSLGERPWLIVDDRRDSELAQKRWSLANRRSEVAWLTDESVPAAEDALDLIETHGIELASPSGEVHPLERAALSVQDDLVLLRRDRDVWHHDASVVCFPTHWHLPSKVGRPVTEVHAPVEGYAERIAAKVTRLFDQLIAHPNPNRVVWRRNFGLTDTTELFQPEYRSNDPEVAADDVLDALFIRSERQTLRRVGDEWVLFTIRIQIEPLRNLLTTRARVERFLAWVTDVPTDIGPKRHLGQAQRPIMIEALADHQLP